MAQTDRQTDNLTNGHGDSMTESAQWGKFSENTATSSLNEVLSHRGSPLVGSSSEGVQAASAL